MATNTPLTRKLNAALYKSKAPFDENDLRAVEAVNNPCVSPDFAPLLRLSYETGIVAGDLRTVGHESIDSKLLVIWFRHRGHQEIKPRPLPQWFIRWYKARSKSEPIFGELFHLSHQQFWGRWIILRDLAGLSKRKTLRSVIWHYMDSNKNILQNEKKLRYLQNLEAEWLPQAEAESLKTADIKYLKGECALVLGPDYLTPVFKELDAKKPRHFPPPQES